MRVCVVGAGAIGGWLAAELALAGCEVSVLARGETLRLINAEGLRLTRTDGLQSVPINAAGDASALGEQDLLIVAVKAPALPALAPALSPLIASDTIILPMLNGVPWWFTEEPLQSADPDGTIAATFAKDQVLGSVVHASCRRVAPNNIQVVHADKLIVGEVDGGITDRVARVCGLFEQANIRCEANENVRRAIWYKLWGNATINPLSALTRSTADKLLDDPAIRAWMAEAMDELAAVGAAIGCPISETAEDRMAVTARLGAFKSSMLQDVESGRPIELEALLGAPREIARRVNVPTPQLDRIYAMTAQMGANLGLA
ncbi:MAG TPA: 2-dehydropantoate 2-reductase [Sphingomicrobium sp.]|jgi:2-dehydropantoate 2-reductase